MVAGRLGGMRGEDRSDVEREQGARDLVGSLPASRRRCSDQRTDPRCAAARSSWRDRRTR